MGCPGSKEKYRENKNTAKHRDGDAAVQPPGKGYDQSRNNERNDNMPRDAAGIQITTHHHELHGENSDRSTAGYPDNKQKQNKTSKQDYIRMLKEEKETKEILKTRIAKGLKMLQDSNAERDNLREQLKSARQIHEKYQHDIHNRERQLLSLQGELTTVKDEKERLLIRLSAMAGAKMTDNNPNITDLSDANRPTKLAEKYSELYDNAWTDAFSQLTEKDMKSEKEAIQILLDTFLNIYKECMTRADTQLEALTKAVISFGTVDGDLSEIMKPLKDRRKKQYAIQVKQLEPIVDQTLKTSGLAKTDPYQIKPFLVKSLELCWLMVIQDPPVYVGCEINIKGQAFDKNIFKEYTASGKTIDFIVWPALYIQEHGALLCKGVAQGQKLKDVIEQTVGPVSPNMATTDKTSKNHQSKSLVESSSSTAISLKQPPTQQMQYVAKKAEHASNVTPSEPQPTDVIQKNDVLLSKGVALGQKKNDVRAYGAQTVKPNASTPDKTNTRASKSVYESRSSTATPLKHPTAQHMHSVSTDDAQASSVTPSKTSSTYQRCPVVTQDARGSGASKQPAKHITSVIVYTEKL